MHIRDGDVHERSLRILAPIQKGRALGVAYYGAAWGCA